MERRLSISLIRVLLVLGLLSGGFFSAHAQNTLSAEKGAIRASWNNVGESSNLDSDSEWEFVEYHLEWTHVNSYGGSLPVNSSSVNFKNGATRIETTSKEYAIPAIYENGVIYARVRPVYRSKSTKRIIAGKWVNFPNGCVVTSNDHDKMNWQAVVDYAEEGKNKEVMTYYDGTMRARQMLTRNSVTNDVLVGETFYDHQGRAAVQTLPVPSMKSEDYICYHDSFNLYTKGNSTLPYDRNAFDLSEEGTPCGVTAQSMTSGSAKYYSPSNEDLSRFNAFIPDAEGYPFSQTEYTPDNTGRIRRQGGVGKQYQLSGADGYVTHPTSYFYGKPSQEDLWKLFGSQCGDFSHYQKNMVRDPNGSIAVSYVDMHGRTVATAMAGEIPTNGNAPLFSGLENRKDTVKTVNLLDRMSVPNGESKSVSSLQFLVSTEGTYRFSYQFDLKNINIGDVCMECNYLLTISIKDECGNNVTWGNEMSGATVNNPTDSIVISLSGADLQNCNDSFSRVLGFSTVLGLGNYQITRVLEVDPSTRMEEVESYLMSENVRGLRDFIDEQIQLTDFTVCNMPDCYSTCLESNPESYEAYVDCLADCLNNQDSITSCKVVEKLMISDFNPGEVMATPIEGEADVAEAPAMQVSGGQYAAYSKESGSYEGMHYTIFDQNNFETIKGDAGFQAVVVASGVPLDSIADIGPFVRNYRSSWAEYLAPKYHPEWPLNVSCDMEKLMQFYQQKMILVETYDEASQLGLLNPLVDASNTNDKKKDDFIMRNPLMFQQLSSKMQNFASYGSTTLNIWQVAILSAIEGDYSSSPASDSVMAAVRSITLPQVAYGNSGCSSIKVAKRNVDWDRVWQTFRSLYLTQRRFVYESVIKNGRSHNKILLGNDELSETNMIQRIPMYEKAQNDAAEIQNQGDIDDIIVAIQGKANEVKNKMWKSCLNQALAQVDGILDDIKGCITQQNIDSLSQIELRNTLKDGFVRILAYSAFRTRSIKGYSSIPAGEAVYKSDDPGDMLNYQPTHFSFSEVLSSAMSQFPNFLNDSCNLDLISDVFPYGEENPNASLKPLDGCGCDLIMQMADAFESQKSTLPYDVHSAQAYFNNETGVYVSNFNSMLCLCKNVYNKNHAWNEAALTELRNSGYSVPTSIVCDTCVPCSAVKAAMGQYQVLSNYLHLQSAFGWNNLLAENSINDYMRKSLTNYLNKTFHMSKTFDEYYNFAEKCNGFSSPKEYSVTECEVTYESKQLVALLNSLLVYHRLEGTINDSRVYKDIHEMVQVKGSTSGTSGSGSSSSSYDANPYGYGTMTKETNISTESECTGDCASVSFSTVNEHTSEMQILVDGQSPLKINFGSDDTTATRLADILRAENVYVDAYSTTHLVVTVIRDGKMVLDTFTISSNDWNFANCRTISSENSLTICRNPKKTFEPEVNECEQELLTNVYHNAKELYDEYIDTLRTSITDQYLSKCFGGLSSEKFDVTYNDSEFHYTLYYYDQAGNLVRTVPPAGVEFVNVDANRDALENDLKNGTQSVFTKHRLETRYVYNSLNQLVYQYMPDHDGFANIQSSGYAYDNNTLQAASAFGVGNEGLSAVLDPTHGSTSMYATYDNGENWAPINLSKKYNLYAVKTLVSGVTLVGGSNGTLFRRNLNASSESNMWLDESLGVPNDVVSISGGMNNPVVYLRNGDAYTYNSSDWQKRSSSHVSGITSLNSVDMDNSSAVAVGYKNQNPAIYVGSVSAGMPGNWNLVNHTDIYTGKIVSIAMDGNKGYVNDENGLLMKTVDGGLNWSILAVSQPETFKQMCMVGTDDLYALRNNGDLLKYDPNNASFSLMRNNVEFISGGDKLIFAKKNSAGVLEVYRDTYSFPFARIDGVSAINGLAVLPSSSSAGVYDVYYVEPAGALKRVKVVWNNILLQYVMAPNPETIMDSNVKGIAAANGKLYLNGNGALSCLGEQGNSVNFSVAADDVWGVNANGRFVVASNKQVKIADNSGLQVANILLPGLNAVGVNGNRAVVVGDNGVVLYSDDMHSFHLLPPCTSENLLSVDYAMVNGVNRAFIGGNNGVLLSFQNGSVSSYPIGEPRHENLSSVRLFNNGTLFLGTDNGSTYKADITNNMGSGWEDVSFSVNAIDCTDGKLWVVGDNGSIIESEY